MFKKNPENLRGGRGGGETTCCFSGTLKKFRNELLLFVFSFGQHVFVQRTQSLLLATALNFSFVAHLFSLILRSLPKSTNISEELCARPSVCVSLPPSLSLSLSRLNSTEKEREKKKNDCTADRSNALAATELWYVVFDTVVVSVVCFPEFLTLLSVFFFLVVSFSEFLMLFLLFFFCMLLRFRVVFVCCMRLAIIVVVVVVFVVVVSVVLRVSVIFHRL